MKRYYIAYGSNLNIRQMRIRCPHARVIGTAVINDYELLFKGSRTGAYLTIEPKEGSEVPVAVWEVTESDEAALDRYEGYPVFYYKKEIELDIRGIRTGKIRRRKCFVYIMHEERKIGVPSLSYVSTCLQGYISFGFDEHYLSEAQIKAVEVAGHEESNTAHTDMPSLRGLPTEGHHLFQGQTAERLSARTVGHVRRLRALVSGQRNRNRSLKPSTGHSGKIHNFFHRSLCTL